MDAVGVTDPAAACVAVVDRLAHVHDVVASRRVA